MSTFCPLLDDQALFRTEGGKDEPCVAAIFGPYDHALPDEVPALVGAAKTVLFVASVPLLSRSQHSQRLCVRVFQST